MVDRQHQTDTDDALWAGCCAWCSAQAEEGADLCQACQQDIADEEQEPSTGDLLDEADGCV